VRFVLCLPQPGKGEIEQSLMVSQLKLCFAMSFKEIRLNSAGPALPGRSARKNTFDGLIQMEWTPPSVLRTRGAAVESSPLTGENSDEERDLAPSP
jgi:hypothetical protein